MNIKNIGMVTKLNNVVVKIQSEVNSQSSLYVMAITKPSIAEDIVASMNPIVRLNPVMWSKDNIPKAIKG